jgi:hypothetical protein
LLSLLLACTAPDPGALSITPEGLVPTEEAPLPTARWGRGGVVHEARAAWVSDGEGGFDQVTGPLRSWWRAEGAHLRQGWTLTSLPGGEGPVVVELAGGAGRWTPGRGRSLLYSAGPELWAVSPAVAWGADGRRLPTRTYAVEGALRIEVDDRGAALPLTIDPVWVPAYQRLDGTSVDDSFGVAMGGGDFNRDGYTDLAIGASTDDRAGYRAGALQVHMGGPTGLDPTPATLVLGEEEGDFWAYSVAGVGDLNRDDYDDLIVGGGGDLHVDVFLGGPGGIGQARSLRLEAPAGLGGFGFDVDRAGDINGDGFGDVIIGAVNSVADHGGSAWLYLGEPAGVGLRPAWHVEGGIPDDTFGSFVAGIGDVDADGYTDLAAGAPEDDREGYRAGHAYVYRGGPGGPALAWEVAGWEGAEMGGGVSAAGDLNADGYDDFLIGAHAWFHGGDGEVHVHLGGPRFADPTPAQIIPGPPVRGAFGRYMSAAGDVDGDGRDDMLVAADNAEVPGLGPTAGGFFLYSGTPAGLDTANPQVVVGTLREESLGQNVVGLRDVNWDGFADIAVGAPGSINVGPWDQPGRVFVYLGYGDRDLDGHVSLEDCDDDDGAVHADAVELPGDGVDQDCDGAELCRVDLDGDGHHAEATVPSDDLACDAPGEADAGAPGGDCDDQDASRYPAAPEVPGDGIDQDCDGEDLIEEVDPTPEAPEDKEPGCSCGQARGAPWGGIVLAAWAWRRARYPRSTDTGA